MKESSMVGLEPDEQNIKTEIDFYDDHHVTEKEPRKVCLMSWDL